jgi:peptidylprolyl isomerase
MSVKMKYFNARKEGNKTSTGLKYVITKKSGWQNRLGAALFIHYAGFLEDGHLLIQV